MNSDDDKYRLSLLEATLEASIDGILVVDHETRKLRQYNRRFLELWNIPVELAARGDDNELIGFVLNQLTDPDQFVNLVIKLYQNPLQESFDRLYFKDGRIFERYSEALSMDNQVKGRVWYFRDVTSQIQLQKQLEEQRIKSTNSARMASLGEMAAGIAHEINNPLSIIAGNTWHLKESIKNGKTDLEKMTNTINVIDTTVKRIADIIKGMRSISRDSTDDPFVTSHLATVIEETLSYCREKFKGYGIDLKVETVSPDLKVSCQPAQISQILLNLLNNSFDAVQMLDEKWVVICLREEDGFAKIKITDSGKGIPADIQAKILQPFFTTKPPGKGTGLGLSISQVIAEAHHGEIYLDKKSKNTCFVLKLPKI